MNSSIGTEDMQTDMSTSGVWAEAHSGIFISLCSTFTSISTSPELAHLPKHSSNPVSFHTSISVHQSKVMGYDVISPSSIYTFYPIGVFWILDFWIFAFICWDILDDRLQTMHKVHLYPMNTSDLQFESNFIQYLLCTYLLTATCHTRLGVEFSVCVIMLAFRLELINYRI